MAAGRGWERAKRCEYYIRDKRAAVLPFIQFLVFISGTSPMGMRWGSLEPRWKSRWRRGPVIHLVWRADSFSEPGRGRRRDEEAVDHDRSFPPVVPGSAAARIGQVPQ